MYFSSPYAIRSQGNNGEPNNEIIFARTFQNKQTTNSVALILERTIPTERPPLDEKLVPTFADRGFHMVSVTNPCGRILGFLDRSRTFQGLKFLAWRIVLGKCF
jgi:CBS-domain-containing membrane protein